jgi:hypothetical protein
MVRVDIGSKTTFIVGPCVGASLATGKSRYPIARNTSRRKCNQFHKSNGYQNKSLPTVAPYRQFIF